MIQPNTVFDFRIEPIHCHASCFQATWIVPAELAYFNGHFPGNPILPAIAVLDGSIVFLTMATQDISLRLRKIINAKFSQPIYPGAQIRIIAHKISDNIWDIEWRSSDTDSTEQRIADLRIGC